VSFCTKRSSIPVHSAASLFTAYLTSRVTSNVESNQLEDEKSSSCSFEKLYGSVRIRLVIGKLPDAFVDISPACWEFSIKQRAVETGVFMHGELVWQCGIVVWVVTTRTKKRTINAYVRNRRSPFTLSNSCRNLQLSGSKPLSDPGALTSTEAYPRILLIKPVNLQVTKGWKIARQTLD
jgi:hypothetical protein